MKDICLQDFLCTYHIFVHTYFKYITRYIFYLQYNKNTLTRSTPGDNRGLITTVSYVAVNLLLYINLSMYYK